MPLALLFQIINMKKLLSLLFITTAALLSSCEINTASNSTSTAKSNANWTHVHISLDDKVIHDEVNKYYIYSSSNAAIDLDLKSSGWVRVSYNNCLLYTSDKCPLCNK